MKDITKKWIDLAQADLDAAQTQFQYGSKRGSAYQIAVFHCHQSIEKLLKAYLVEYDFELRKTHDLTYLRAATLCDFPEEVAEFIDHLNPHYLFPRYPDLPFSASFTFSYTRKNVTHILLGTEKSFVWLKRELIKKK